MARKYNRQEHLKEYLFYMLLYDVDYYDDSEDVGYSEHSCYDQSYMMNKYRDQDYYIDANLSIHESNKHTGSVTVGKAGTGFGIGRLDYNIFWHRCGDYMHGVFHSMHYDGGCSFGNQMEEINNASFMHEFYGENPKLIRPPELDFEALLNGAHY